MPERIKRNRSRSAVWALLGVLILLFFVSFSLGKYPISPGELLRVLWGKLIRAAPDWPAQLETVIFNIRLPRLLAAVLVGGGLSAAGAAYQGLFKNPLVSPDMLGASSGAGFGAAVALYFSLGYAMTSLSAFAFGLIAVLAAYLISTRARRNPTMGLVLAGIMIGQLFQAALSFIKLIADPHETLPAITYWLMGSLASVRIGDVRFAAPPILLGFLALFLMRWQLNLATLGDDEARSLGVSTKALRAVTIAAATLMTAASVAISGVVGWVGLVVPHLARLLVGNDYRALLPASALLGASFLLIVDDIARTVATSEIPLGILTAFVGAPFFIYLIFDRGNRL